MKKFSLVGIGLLVLSVAVFAGCTGRQSGSSKGNVKATKKDADDDHDHGPGPHGGTIIEFGKYHGEFTVNHKTQQATIYILGADAKKAAPIQVDKLLLSIRTPQFQVDLKAAPQEGDPPGKSSRFSANHENFGKEQEFEGTLSGLVAGTPYAGDFKEEHVAPAKEKK